MKLHRDYVMSPTPVEHDMQVCELGQACKALQCLPSFVFKLLLIPHSTVLSSKRSDVGG